MTWYDNKSAGDIIRSQDWDDQASVVVWVSGSYFGHSSNKDLHFPSSQLLSWLNALYQESGISAISDVSWSGASDFYGFSSNTALVKNGYAKVSNGDTIAHGLPSTPSYANISPSGFSINFGATCKVDESNITVYLTTDGSRDIFWTASI